MIPSPIQIYPEVYNHVLKSSFPKAKVVHDYLKDPKKPQRIVKNMCQNLNLPFLDLYPIFFSNNNQVLYVPHDGHFNEAGSR